MIDFYLMTNYVIFNFLRNTSHGSYDRDYIICNAIGLRSILSLLTFLIIETLFMNLFLPQKENLLFIIYIVTSVILFVISIFTDIISQRKFTEFDCAMSTKEMREKFIMATIYNYSILIFDIVGMTLFIDPKNRII